MKQKVVLLGSNVIGKGNEALGEVILETFFTLLKQQEQVPYAVFCMNSGVLAMTEQSLVHVHLQELERRGTRMLACKTCAEAYEVADALAVGEIGTMQDFVKLASEFEVLTIS
ncbi:transcriptional regulator [Ectobacillus ponti]|uniref:Transcriptional regulator n=1 Tax=Ectobacillus ponti TaxID=2961894 RepID=A0AA41X7V6_9BACI|nr:transcriptional regulator [Ectobacillus ponti]MCP8968284.1 transcriptional regulator [Ectobacillus ponti]